MWIGLSLIQLSDAVCFVCAALLWAYMWKQRAMFSFLSRGNVNKHVYGGETFVACSSPQHHQPQTMWNGDIIRPYIRVIPSFPPHGTGTPRTPGSCARTIGEFLSKQEARMGPKRLQQPSGPLTLHQHRAPAKAPKTDWCMTGWHKNWLYLLPSVEETLLLRAYIEDVLYFQP